MFSNRSRDLPAVVVVAFSLVLVPGCSSQDDATGTNGSAGGASGVSSRQEPEITVTAADLAAAFTEDPSAAGEKYGDKAVKVTGVVGTQLTSDVAGDKYINFGEPIEDNEFQAILKVYLLPDERSKAEELWRGQAVTVAGTCVAPAFGDAFLSDGRIEEIGAAIPAIEIAAGDLISEFQADADAANDKYRYKVLVVSGIVAARDDDEHTVEISGEEESGDNPIRLQIRYSPVEKELIAALEEFNPGDAIRLKAECGRTSIDGTRVSLYYVRILKP